MAEPLLIGSGNRHKTRELSELLAGLPWAVQGLADLPEAPPPEEDGATFEDNAVKKAIYYAERFDRWCVADDSGLVVDALDGAPGVYSARYAGPDATDADNSAKLLAALADVPDPKRTARFVCCAALARPGEAPHVEMGAVEGRIGFVCRGRRGFGYDPLFTPAGRSETFAEMDPADKHAISHRGLALGKLRLYLASLP